MQKAAMFVAAIALTASGAIALTAGKALAEPVKPSAVVYADGAVAKSLTGVAGDQANGRKVMGTRGLGNCVACHKVTALKDVAWHGEVGPPLDGAASRWTVEQLRGIVANAKKTFPESMMPSFYKDSGYIRPGDDFTGKAAKKLEPLLTAQQIEDVVAYLATLKD